MARPLPDAREAKARAVELGEMIDALGGLSAAAAVLRDAGVGGAGSLKRFRRGDAVAPDDLMEAMRTMIAQRPRWLLARDEKRRPWIVHNHAPAFSARIVDGNLRDIIWHAGQPSPRVHGDLLTQASELINGSS